jgi:uncharacterized protein
VRPQRTCVGCRKVRPKMNLMRLVRMPTGEVAVDARGREGGRGAYVCPDAGCLAQGLERGRLAHAFKKPCEVRASLAEEVRERWQLAK